MEIGQEVYLEPRNNAARSCKEIRKCKISKIGRKYFEVEEMNWTRFFISTMQQDAKGYTSNYQVYTDLKELEDKKEAQAIYDNVRKVFSGWNTKLTLSQLKSIEAIINFA